MNFHALSIVRGRRNAGGMLCIEQKDSLDDLALFPNGFGCETAIRLTSTKTA